ncbi:arylsulfatase [Telmatocola sphagniphila]|uniref:Arylsulfatase n=1 Tax=Telmatocola sphagniphila TaxID=1123043 RepID=A0A8E6EXG7_9BACT|nr:arylsulfatase [Telmatocola sphagniphila]QVL31241.1 arylsulfatase [Telmatocola sphagniphila]
MAGRYLHLLGCLCLLAASGALRGAEPTKLPNIVFLIADDLGYGDLGCYGQTKIRTPNIDKLATEGMRFSNHYSGSNVCAPSRCTLMTGKHPGHGYIRENHQAKGYSEGQEPVPAGLLKMPLRLQEVGYTLGGFGKWGLGPVTSSGDPLKQGFDRWYGYNCQAEAHNYYPTHLWDNDKQITLNNPKFAAHQKLPKDADVNNPASYAAYSGKDYAPDLIGEKALEFVRANKDKPFFLYFATTVPHLALQVPEDSLQEYAGKFPETPYTGDRSYLPHRQPRAAYAAMITRMDRDIGRILSVLRELHLDENTIVVFTSDNGPLYDKLGGTDTEFFNSAAGLRGRKGSYYEGGFREPCIVRWPGHIAPNSQTDRVSGFEDWFPTFMELVGRKDKTPADIDGISFAPTLLGQKQPERPFLYRESPGYGGQQCVRVGNWKALRRNLNPALKAKDQNPGPIELYDLANDPFEKTDLAKIHPEIVSELQLLLDKQHVKSDLFPMRVLDAKKN